MVECLLIKVDITDLFNNFKFCEYYQILREEFYSVKSNSIEYNYYNTLLRPFKKRLSRYIVDTILLSYTYNAHIAKNDDEYLNKYFCYGSATIVYKYTI